jgi:hydroxyacylglutathione hydrolase-like protein/glutathione S-transferase-like protein
MKLYTFPPSPNARKAAAVVAHLGLTDVEHALVRLHKGEHRQPDYLDINPMGKVPALQDGDLTLWESNAICHYLADRADDTSFFPAAPKIRADIVRWPFWEAANLPEQTEVYCGHDYTLANLRFAIAVEPNNAALLARDRAEQARRDRGEPNSPSTIALEKATNPFLRLLEPELVRTLRARTGRTSNTPSENFEALREWKDVF